MKAFFSVEDRNARLHNTVCMYDGEPVYVSTRDVGGQNTSLKAHEVFITPLKQMENSSKDPVIKTVSYTDDKFSTRGMRLGYVNVKNDCVFVTRRPGQQTRQGLSVDQINIVINGNSQGNATRLSIFQPEVAYTILGEYPSWQEAYARVKGDAVSCAFDRMFAFARLGRRSYSILLRGLTVGHFDGQHATLFAGRETRLIKKALTEKGISCHVGL